MSLNLDGTEYSIAPEITHFILTGGITADGKIKDYGAKPFNLKTNLSVAKFPEI